MNNTNKKEKNYLLSDKQIAYADTLFFKLKGFKLPVEEISKLRKFDLDTLVREVETKEPATEKQVEVVNKILANPENEASINYHNKWGLNKYTAGKIIDMAKKTQPKSTSVLDKYLK